MIFLCSNINHLNLFSVRSIVRLLPAAADTPLGNISTASSCNAAETVIVAGPDAMTNGDTPALPMGEVRVRNSPVALSAEPKPKNRTSINIFANFAFDLIPKFACEGAGRQNRHASAANPKFAQVCGALGCELRVQKRHYKDRVASVLIDSEVRTSVPKMLTNFGIGTLENA